MFNQGVKSTEWGKKVVLTNGAGATGYPHKKNK